MARVKGIVAEIEGSKCVLITADGQFIQVNKPLRAVPGEEIEVAQVTVPWRRVLPAIAAVLLLCILIPTFNQLSASAKPVAYLSLDINPSLDIGVNKAGAVVSVKGLNPQGEQLANNTPVTKLPVNEAVQSLVQQAIKQGYINGDKANLIVAAYTSGTSYTFNDQELQTELVDELQAVNLNAEIVIVNTDLKEHQQAEANQVSQGKLHIYQVAKAKGNDLSLQELKADSINQALQQHNLKLNEVLAGIIQVEPKSSDKGQLPNGNKAGKGDVPGVGIPGSSAPGRAGGPKVVPKPEVKGNSKKVVPSEEQQAEDETKNKGKAHDSGEFGSGERD